MTLINQADKLVILLIFVNNEHFVNAVMGKVSQADKMQMQTMCGQGNIRSNLAKAIIRENSEITYGTVSSHYENEITNYKINSTNEI